jgi:protein TonB
VEGADGNQGFARTCTKSKAFGAAGAAALHSCVVLACVLVSTRPAAKPPQRVEPLRINLAEPVAPTFRPPPPTPVADAPKPRPIENETKPPDAEPPVESAAAPEGLDGLAEPAQSKEPVSGPAATTDHQRGGGGRARTLEEAKQAILAALVASLEQEKRYPAAARRLGVEGLVMAQVQIDGAGRIVGAGVKGSADPLLEKAAADALQRVQKKWRPIPLPEPVTVNVPIRYNLEK